MKKILMGMIALMVISGSTAFASNDTKAPKKAAVKKECKAPSACKDKKDCKDKTACTKVCKPTCVK
jgi:uncharacterized protein YxeA